MLLPFSVMKVNFRTENGNHNSVLRRELLESDRSWFPFRSRGLRVELRQAEERLRIIEMDVRLLNIVSS